jgi:hypothetical protein
MEKIEDADAKLLARLLKNHEKQMERVRKYNENHRQEMSDRSKAYFQKIKADPEKYKLYLEKKKISYKEKNPKQVLPVKEFA